MSADLAVKALVESFEKEEGRGGQPAGSSTGCGLKVWESQVYLSPQRGFGLAGSSTQCEGKGRRRGGRSVDPWRILLLL